MASTVTLAVKVSITPDCAVEHVGAQHAVGPALAEPAGGEQVHRHLPGPHLDAARLAGGEQAALHLAPGGVLHVRHPPPAVPALAGEVQAGAEPVELHAQ